MYAERGDRLVIRSHGGLSGRDAEILEVCHPDGSPPYRVRWSDSGHQALVFPGHDAYIEHFSHGPNDRAREREVLSTAETLTSKTWHVRIDIGEHEGTTYAVAHLDTGCGTDLRGVGEARVNPHDLDVPAIGDELASARALSHLADNLLDIAAGDLTQVLHAAVNLGP